MTLFDLDTSDSAPLVKRSGKLFECGEYKDKGFTFTTDDLAAFIASAPGPVPVNIAHVPTVLDGKLGTVHNFTIGADGKSLYGDAFLPKWFDDALGDTPRRVSCEWLLADKTLDKVSLVLNPRVADAALLAAFARHDTRHGQYKMQDIHDMAATAGAVCKKPTGKAAMASSHEAKAFQAVHDLASEHGAKCDDGSNRSSSIYYERESGMADQEEIDKSVFASLKRFFSGAAAEAPPAPAAGTSPAAGPTERERQLEAELAKEREERVQTEAAAFADAEFAAKRIKPFEKAMTLAAFAQARRDDIAHPVKVTFALGNETKEGSRVDALKASYAARDPHTLDEEQMADPKGQAGAQTGAPAPQRTTLSNEPADPAAMTQEREDQLLATTPLGQAILRERAGAANGKGPGK